MIATERDCGGTSVAIMTGPGESPRETTNQPQQTSISKALTPNPRVSNNCNDVDDDGDDIKKTTGTAAGSQSGEATVEENMAMQSSSSEVPTNGAVNDNPGRQTTDNVSSEHEDATNAQAQAAAATTTDSTEEAESSADDDFAQPAATAKRPSTGSDCIGKSQLAMQPIAPAPMSSASVPLAAAPSSGHPHTPLATPSSMPSTGSGGSKKGGSSLRRGKWTVEEEAYVARVIQDFNSGFLNAPAGTTLRSYLSEKLQCDPMRITKKFTGESCIGKRVFHPAVRSSSNAAAIDKAQAELESLERRWRRRLEMQQRESAKKAAASAAAAAAASGRNHGFVMHGMGAGMPGSQVAGGVAQTATWLDRASSILNGSGSEVEQTAAASSQQKFSLTQEQIQALQSLPKKEIEMQMKEVERLIHEGPIIQQTTAGLGQIPDQSASAAAGASNANGSSPKVPSMIVAHSSDFVSDGQKTPPEPADKRMRTGAEDAEALVGFLTAVRASAAAGTDSLSG